MTFGPVNASVGTGFGVVSAWFRFDRWIPDTFNLDIRVNPDEPIPFGFDISGILAHGSASGNLNLAMEDYILNVSGELTAQNAEISLNAEELGAEHTPSDSRVSTMINLAISTGRRVEFYWPSSDFPVLQAYADLGTGIRIIRDGETRRFSLVGDVRLRSGEIFYLERNFYIREGTLFFNESEAQFDPRITARAEIRDQGEEGPVTISMIIENALLRSFSPRFESDPPLSQLEIFSMLGQSPSTDNDPTNQRNILISSGIDAFTQFAVVRRFQRGVRNVLNLDMFSFRTNVVQNMVFQASGFNDRSASTDSSTDTSINDQRSRNRVGNYFDNTTLFLGKYIGSDIFARGLFSFRYDESKETWGGMRLEPEIAVEMKNPLFDIQFSIIPLHPENWFINDVSLSLIWRRTF
jgi:hypothetical protein